MGWGWRCFGSTLTDWSITVVLMPEPAMTNNFTAVYQAAEEGGFIAFVEELPGAITQGETIEEARANLQDAIQLVLEANREQNRHELADDHVIREMITVTR